MTTVDGLGNSVMPNLPTPWEPIDAAIRAPAELPHRARATSSIAIAILISSSAR